MRRSDPLASSTQTRYLRTVQVLTPWPANPTVASQPDVKASSIIGGHVSTATDKVKEFDQQKGITSVFLDYYSKAMNTNTGQK
jgi:hypothetical protein